LTRVLVGLYEDPEKPPNAVDYIKKFLGTPSDIDVDKLRVEYEQLKEENAQLKAEVIELRKEVLISSLFQFP